MTAHDPPQSRPREGVKARLLDDLRRYLVVSGYLYVCFLAITPYKVAILRDEGIAYLPLGFAAAKALILGKFVLIGDAARVGSRVGGRSLLQRVVRRVVLLVALLIALVVVEELLVGGFHGRPPAQTLAEYLPRLPEVLSMLLLLLLILVPPGAVTEVSRAMGPGALRELFLAPPRPGGAGDVPARSRRGVAG